MQLMADNPGRVVFAHPCIVDAECDGCPEGARCEPGVPIPLPSPGYCFGHGRPSGEGAAGVPFLKPWVAREYWSGDAWLVGALLPPPPSSLHYSITPLSFTLTARRLCSLADTPRGIELDSLSS